MDFFFGKCYLLMSYSVGSQERSAKMPTDTYIQQRNESNRKARAFLQEVLAGGPQTYQIVHEQAVKQGISSPTCWRPSAVSMSHPPRVMGMRSGPQTYQIVHEQAVKQGISKSYLLTARRSLHVESYKSDGYAVWSLPAAA